MKKNDILLGIVLGIFYYLLLIIVYIFFGIYSFMNDLFLIPILFILFPCLFPCVFKIFKKKKFYQAVLYSFLALLIYIIIILVANKFLVRKIIIDENGGVGEGTSFNDEYYDTNIFFAYTEEGKLIGKAGTWSVLEVPEDKNNNFIIFRSFLDQTAAVKESYIIPKSGAINVVYLNHDRYTNDDIKKAVKYLTTEELSDGFNITIDSIYRYMINIYIGYEDCPVGTEDGGMLGYINDKLVYIKPIEYNYDDEELENVKEEVYTCYVVPEKYAKVFKNIKHIPKTNMNIDK